MDDVFNEENESFMQDRALKLKEQLANLKELRNK